jgi:hypothetical protein
MKIEEISEKRKNYSVQLSKFLAYYNLIEVPDPLNLSQEFIE